MKKILILSILVIVTHFVFNFYGIGPFRYQYSICENGFYSTYPNHTTDNSTTYFDSNNTLVGVCPSWIPTAACIETREKVGKCTDVGYLKFFFTKKLGL